MSLMSAAPSTSIYTAELHAIMLALLCIHSSSSPFFLLLSDSFTALKSFSYFLHDFHIQKGKRVVFCWVPAHVGIIGNERVDRAARRAAERDFSSYFHNFSIPYSVHFPIIRTFLDFVGSIPGMKVVHTNIKCSGHS